MQTMYERIKEMTEEEMKQFIYWVYENGYDDCKVGLKDSYNIGYFGGGVLFMYAEDVMSEYSYT